MGKNEEHEKYVDLLEENYLMLKVIKASESSVYTLDKSLETIGDALEVVKKELELFGDVTELLDTTEALVESLKDTTQMLAESYSMVGTVLEDDGTDEEGNDGNT